MACEEGYNLEKKFNESVRARVAAEENLQTSRELFTDKWDDFKAAEERWTDAVHKKYQHIANCPNCYANPPS
ncbi:hypothetical protein HDF11_002993 [Tunturiibacter psychrotolerans]